MAKKNIVPANYRDPAPNPARMGWGKTTQTDADKRRAERKLIESLPMVCMAKDAAGASTMIAEIEAKIRAQFKFDSGWSFFIAEQMVYKLGAEATLMISQNIGNCFPAGTLIQLADGSHKPIEDMRVRDVVVTAEGRTGMVRQTMTRDVDEPLVRVKLWGHYGLTMTDEHPLLTKRGYVEAKNIQIGDEVAVTRYAPKSVCKVIQTACHSLRLSSGNSKTYRKVSRRSVFGTGGERREITVCHSVPDLITLDHSFGRLIGFFLAEGSTEYGKVKWSFSVKEQSTFAAEVVALCRSLFGIECSVKTINRGSVCQVILHSVQFADVFKSLCGSGPTGKQIHSDLLAAPKEFQQAMISAWLDGDGYSRGNETQGTTVSKKLAHGIFTIANQLGMKPGIRLTKPKISHGVKSRQLRYDVIFSTAKPNDHIAVTEDDSAVWHKVRAIERIEYCGPVFNFSVVGDESYVADGIGVHNCVGASHVALLAARIAHEILCIGDPEEPLGVDQLAMPFIPYTYGVGRWVGGMLGPGDGSYCGAQIEGTQTHGFLPCFTPGLENYDGTLPQASAKVGRKFGSSKAEIQKWTQAASTFDLTEAPVARSTDDVIKLIEIDKVPLQICSSIMPGGKVDMSNGFPVYTGFVSASHSTQLMASFTYKGKKFLVDRNQWGYGAHLGAPEIGIPKGCLVFPAENMDKWIKKSECIGLGSIQGLPSNPGA